MATVDETQFLALIRENQGIISKLTGLYARDSEEKKEFYQEILFRAWKGWASFRGDAKFSTWLYSICLNTILTKKRKPGIIDYQESLESVSPNVQHEGIRQEHAKSLQQAIRLLIESDRAIISMHLDGFTNTEIADLMGISVNHAAVKLHRIKQQLTNILTVSNEHRTKLERSERGE